MRGVTFSLMVRQGEHAIELSPRGLLDETSALTAPRTNGRPVIIDASELRRMNSMGVASWLRFIADLCAQGPVVVRRLSPALVTQASMISTFLGDAKVESFISPWVCPTCDATAEQLHGYGDLVPASIPCQKCNNIMELDWDREAFLAFRTP